MTPGRPYHVTAGALQLPAGAEQEEHAGGGGAHGQAEPHLHVADAVLLRGSAIRIQRSALPRGAKAAWRPAVTAPLWRQPAGGHPAAAVLRTLGFDRGGPRGGGGGAPHLAQHRLLPVVELRGRGERVLLQQPRLNPQSHALDGARALARELEGCYVPRSTAGIARVQYGARPDSVQRSNRQMLVCRCIGVCAVVRTLQTRTRPACQRST